MSLVQLRSRGILDGTISASDLATGVGGKVLQVVSTTKRSIFNASIASATYTDVTGLSVSITPSSASNKILIICHVVASIDNDDNRQFIALKRNSTLITDAAGDNTGAKIPSITIASQSNGNTGTTHFFNYLDSPSSTSSLTYQIAMAQGTGLTKTINVNISSDTSNNSYIAVGASTITVMEIAV